MSSAVHYAEHLNTNIISIAVAWNKFYCKVLWYVCLYSNNNLCFAFFHEVYYGFVRIDYT